MTKDDAIRVALDTLKKLWLLGDNAAIIANPAIDALQAAIDAPEDGQTPPYGSRRKAAMAVYTPPFKFMYGYIYDSGNRMVADNGEINGEQSVEGAVAARVRGWGRIGYMPNAKQLQDEIGQMMADALNAFYTRPSSSKPLTDEQLIGIMERLGITVAGPASDAVEALARAIEAAHGITEVKA